MRIAFSSSVTVIAPPITVGGFFSNFLFEVILKILMSFLSILVLAAAESSQPMWFL